MLETEDLNIVWDRKFDRIICDQKVKVDVLPEIRMVTLNQEYNETYQQFFQKAKTSIVKVIIPKLYSSPVFTSVEDKSQIINKISRLQVEVSDLFDEHIEAFAVLEKTAGKVPLMV